MTHTRLTPPHPRPPTFSPLTIPKWYFNLDLRSNKCQMFTSSLQSNMAVPMKSTAGMISAELRPSRFIEEGFSNEETTVLHFSFGFSYVL